MISDLVPSKTFVPFISCQLSAGALSFIPADFFGLNFDSNRLKVCSVILIEYSSHHAQDISRGIAYDGIFRSYFHLLSYLYDLSG